MCDLICDVTSYCVEAATWVKSMYVIIIITNVLLIQTRK